MFDSPPVSQLTLMKLNSEAQTKCTVFCAAGNALKRFEIEFHEGTTVNSIISETIKLLKEKCPCSKIDEQQNQFNLYASKRSGRKISDLPCFENKQKIGMTGVKHFYLSCSEEEQKQMSKRQKASTATTKSIQSMMVGNGPKVQEIKASKGVGCFCFS